MAVPFEGDSGRGRRTRCPPAAAATAARLWIFARLTGALAAELNLSTIAYSNLAGKGPDIRKPHSIRYHHVATADGTALDLLVAAAEDRYSAYDPEQNVLSGRGHQIRNVNLQAGTDVDLIFRFVKSGTSALMMVGQLHFSVYVVDSRQRVQVGSYTSEALNRMNRYCRTNGTGLRFETLRNPSGISVTARSNFPAFHPSDPHGLTSTEKNWVVTFSLVDVSEFPVRVSVSGPVSNDGLNFMFSGAASVDEYCSPWADDGRGGPSGDSHRAISHGPGRGQPAGAGASPGDCGDDLKIDATNGPDLFSQVLSVLDRGRGGNGTSGPCSPRSSNGTSPSDEQPGAASDLDAAAGPNSSTSTTGAAEPHDCQADEDARRTEWSDAKRDWCCRHERLGCSAVDPFDCRAGRGAWEKGWSDAKKAWCCEHRGSGCATSATTTAAASSATTATGSATTATGSATTSGRLDCHEAGNFTVECDRVTTTAPDPAYNCTEGHPDWTGNWSSARRRWCCEHHSRGCTAATNESVASAAAATEPLRSEAAARSATSITRTTTAESTEGVAAAAATTTESTAGGYTYDCGSEFSHRNTSWSHVKKAWCCEHFSVGCRLTTTVRATTSAPHDCEAGFQNWVNGWSAGKKAWCCKHFSRACPSATTIIIANSEPYDCAAGLHNWKSGWSAGKKIWCCSHHGLACPRPVAAAAVATTTTYIYDCEVGAETWDQSWSYVKRTWCCERYGPGCSPGPQTTTPTAAAGATSQSAVAAATAATTGSMPTTAEAAAPTEIYDCKAAGGWSLGKRRWCCERYSLGCPSEPFDCLTGLAHWQHGWSEGKKRWCCEHYGRGCYAAQEFYHCGTELTNWDKAWSPAKKQWCCGAKGVGCTTSPAPPKQGVWIGKSERHAGDGARRGGDARRPRYLVHAAMFGACCLGFLALFTLVRSSDREAMSARTPSTTSWTHSYVKVDSDDEAPN